LAVLPTHPLPEAPQKPGPRAPLAFAAGDPPPWAVGKARPPLGHGGGAPPPPPPPGVRRPRPRRGPVAATAVLWGGSLALTIRRRPPSESSWRSRRTSFP